MSMFIVEALHNVSADTFTRYDPETSKLFHAHSFQVGADSRDQALNLAWTLGNFGVEDLPAHLSLYALQINEYRERMNRSLSVSDVLVVWEVHGDEARLAGVFCIEPVGFRELEDIPPYERSLEHVEHSASYYAHQEVLPRRSPR